jgi:hypothetical protein
VLDQIAEVPCFGEAMAFVGWAVEDQEQDTVCFPNFFAEEASPSERHRVKAAERQRRYRQKNVTGDAKSDAKSDVTGDVTGDVTVQRNGNVTVTPREEKRREEKKREYPPTPQGGAVAEASPPEVKPRKSRDAAVEAVASDPAFGRFWAAYPRKVGKLDAQKAWLKIAPDAALVEALLSAVAAQARAEQWRRDGGRFVPHPATWLNGRHWEDEVAPPGAAAKTTTGETLKEQVDRLMKERAK